MKEPGHGPQGLVANNGGMGNLIVEVWRESSGKCCALANENRTLKKRTCWATPPLPVSRRSNRAIQNTGLGRLLRMAIFALQRLRAGRVGDMVQRCKVSFITDRRLIKDSGGSTGWRYCETLEKVHQLDPPGGGGVRGSLE